MAGTIKYISRGGDNNTLTVLIEYNTGTGIVWQEYSTFTREQFCGFSSAAQFHQEVILPQASEKIKQRIAMETASEAAQTQITNGTVFAVPGT